MTKAIKVKAVIRYNKQDGQQVVYFRQNKRFFKMLDGRRIRPMSKFIGCFATLCYTWSPNISVTVVNSDEQVLWKGKPTDIQMDVFNFKADHLTVV